MRLMTLLIVLLLGLFSLEAQARPLSYPSGVMVMTENSGDDHALDLIYTLTTQFGAGVHVGYDAKADVHHYALAVNTLVWRGNYPDAQANFYVLSGVGTAHEAARDSGLIYGGIEADWENRRFYTQYQNRYFYAGDVKREFEQKARIGVAPYIGEAGDVHTWLILQANHMPQDEDNFTLTPLVRMFYNTHLVEVGYSDNNELLFNYTHQF
jgi:hypothetical protein